MFLGFISSILHCVALHNFFSNLRVSTGTDGGNRGKGKNKGSRSRGVKGSRGKTLKPNPPSILPGSVDFPVCAHVHQDNFLLKYCQCGSGKATEQDLSLNVFYL